MPSHPTSVASSRSADATHADLLRILGDVDERKVMEILALRPTLAEVEEAVFWIEGSGDLIGKAGHPLTGIAAEIFEILTADQEEPAR
jgi:hypothetical protein